MNEEQYQSLCEVCDRVLLAPNSTIERIAIAWLHVIREHPMFLTRYEDLFKPVKSGKVIVGRCLRILRSKAGWIRQIARSLLSDGQPWFGPEDLPRGIDVLFVSHLLNSSQDSQEDDFYFGGLPNEMVARGHCVVIALINHSGQVASYFADKWKGSLVPRAILTDSLRFWEVVALHRRLKKESLRLRKIAKNESPGLAQRILSRASEEALSGGSLSTLMMVSQISALAAKLQPKAILVTHEGHAWERMSFTAARSVNPNIRCIGYQHAALFRLQHAIRRNLGPQYNPDHILTAGEISQAQLSRAPGLRGIPVTVLGSNRTFKGNNANAEGQLHPSQAGQLDSSACLVIPEGFVSECYHLFEFSLACVRVTPGIQFIWRLHPLVSFKSLLAHNPKLRNLPRNIILSQSTLEEDIARCRWALYRGTTAIVQAVVAGLRPIYLQLPGEMTIDPLYELKDWRVSVETIVDFHRVITGQDRLPMYSESDMIFAEKYCGDFFKSLNPDAFEAAIISKGTI